MSADRDISGPGGSTICGECKAAFWSKWGHLKSCSRHPSDNDDERDDLVDADSGG